MSVISDGLELLKLVNKGAHADLYGRLGKLIEEARDLYSQREDLEQQNRLLLEQLRFKGAFIRVGGNVYIDGDDEALCSRCADVDCRPVHVIEQDVPPRGITPVCPQCKAQHRYPIRRSSAEQLARRTAR